jgi:hypothetical protein
LCAPLADRAAVAPSLGEQPIERGLSGAVGTGLDPAALLLSLVTLAQSWFSEGFGTPDLIEAKMLLEEMR